MNVVSKGEDASDLTALKLISKAIASFKMERNGSTPGVDTIFLNTEKKMSNEEIWKLKIDKLKEFSLPLKDSSDTVNNHIIFLETIQSYLNEHN